MVRLFREWFFGVFEDDALPCEIAHINFMISEYDDRYEVGFSGDERPFEKSIPGEYYPLEAQAFLCEKYYKLRPYGRENVFKITTDLILDVAKLIKSCDDILLGISPNGRFGSGNITITVGFRGENALFLVKC